MHALLTQTLGGWVCTCGHVVQNEAAMKEHIAQANAVVNDAGSAKQRPPAHPRVERELVGRKGAQRTLDPRAVLRDQAERAAKAAAEAEEHRRRTRPRH
ncbi:MAG: hypothetical protein WDA16_01770 [Candidatus Thermoplasmatota archaeon]